MSARAHTPCLRIFSSQVSVFLFLPFFGDTTDNMRLHTSARMLSLGLFYVCVSCATNRFWRMTDRPKSPHVLMCMLYPGTLRILCWCKPLWCYTLHVALWVAVTATTNLCGFNVRGADRGTLARAFHGTNFWQSSVAPYVHFQNCLSNGHWSMLWA